MYLEISGACMLRIGIMLSYVVLDDAIETACCPWYLFLL